MALRGAPSGKGSSKGQAPAVYLAALGRKHPRIDHNRDEHLRETI